MPNEMWWKPEILLKEPSRNILRDPEGYVQMWGIVAWDFTDEVYCEPCADEIIRRIEQREHHSDGEKIQVWVRDQGFCHSCGKNFLAVHPKFIAVETEFMETLARREYVQAWGRFSGDGTYITYCMRCGPKYRRPPEDTTTTMHRIWLRRSYACAECKSVISPAVEYPPVVRDLNEEDKNMEPSPQPKTPAPKVDHRGELEEDARCMSAAVAQFLFALDNMATHRRESEKAYSHVHLFKDLRKSATLPMIKEQMAEDIASDLQHVYEEAMEETQTAERALESGHEQLGRVVENIVYHTAMMCLRNGVGSFTKLMPVWVDEAVERAVKEHDAETGEAN